MLCLIESTEYDMSKAEGAQSKTKLTLSIITMIALGAIIISLVIIAGLMYYYFHDYHKTQEILMSHASQKSKKRKSNRAKMEVKSIKQFLAKQRR